MADEIKGSRLRTIWDYLVLRVWPPISKLAKGVTWVTAFVAGISAILLWAPAVHNQIMWRDVEYDLIDKVNAGHSSAYVDGVFGKPAIVRGLETAPGLVEQIYIRRDYYVMTVVDESQSVLLYSVLSCSPDFSPSFESPSGSQIELQSVPLSESESHPGYSGSYDPNDDRVVTYVPALTASSLGQLIEAAALGGSNAGRAKYWFVGVNSACADTSGFGDVPFVEPGVDDLPADAATRRTTMAANFYAETAIGLDVSVDAEGDLFLGDYSMDGDYSGLHVSPFHFGLPQRDKVEGTRTF